MRRVGTWEDDSVSVPVMSTTSERCDPHSGALMPGAPTWLLERLGAAERRDETTWQPATAAQHVLYTCEEADWRAFWGLVQSVVLRGIKHKLHTISVPPASSI